jgi:hypothetical protein
MVEAQQRLMEIERRELEAVMKKKCAILVRVTFLDKSIKIPDLE